MLFLLISFYFCLLPLAATENTHTYTYTIYILKDFTDFIKSPNIRDQGMAPYNFQQPKFGKEHKRNKHENCLLV